MKFGKIIIYVADVAASLEFFEKAFGLKAAHFVQEAGYGDIEIGETTLAFASFESGQQHLPDGLVCARPSPSDVSVEVALISETVEGDFKRAVEAGAQPLQEPQAKPWGQTVSYLRAPYGTIINLSSPVAAWN